MFCRVLVYHIAIIIDDSQHSCVVMVQREKGFPLFNSRCSQTITLYTVSMFYSWYIQVCVRCCRHNKHNQMEYTTPYTIFNVNVRFIRSLNATIPNHYNSRRSLPMPMMMILTMMLTMLLVFVVVAAIIITLIYSSHLLWPYA